MSDHLPDVGRRPHRGAMPAISRGLRSIATTPPETRAATDPGGVAEERFHGRWHPFGVRTQPRRYRGCRFAQPPAKGCQPSGLEDAAGATARGRGRRSGLRQLHPVGRKTPPSVMTAQGNLYQAERRSALLGSQCGAVLLRSRWIPHINVSSSLINVRSASGSLLSNDLSGNTLQYF